MSTFLGNFSCKFSFQFQYRPFSLPGKKISSTLCLAPDKIYGVSHNKYLIFSPAFRMTKNNALCCMKNRAYGSVPVRYIPKKSYKVEDSKSLKSSEDEEIQDCVRIRASDGGRSYRTTFAWDEKNKIQDKKPMNNLIFDAESESEEAIDCDVRVVDFEFMQEPEDVVKEFRIYQEKDYPELDVSQVNKSKQDAEKLAIELLATRAYTAVELKKKLHGKRVACDITEAVINDFQSRFMSTTFWRLVNRDGEDRVVWMNKRMKNFQSKPSYLCGIGKNRDFLSESSLEFLGFIENEILHLESSLGKDFDLGSVKEERWDLGSIYAKVKKN
ncbi:hypothetical protein CK203_012060 [Vitis vinifera]|uniref:Uncharacterized protein n=1 Tax=Vitis vinifera TaxID=29760 RepID=A0A438K033_VITVI|nr:hypothetical protein CK203_012060 [Vitis vinifera]